MHILQVNKFYYRRRGAETYMLDLIDLLQAHQHETGVFSMHHPENIQSDIYYKYSKYFISNIEFKNINALSFSEKLQSVERVLWNREAQKNMTALLEHETPDIAHIHNIYHQISPSILPVLKNRGVPIIHTLHDYKLLSANYKLLVNGKINEQSRGGKYYREFFGKTMKDSWSASLLGMVEMYLHKWMQVYEKNVDCFISPSVFLKDKMEEWGINAKRIEVLPNFIDTSVIQPSYKNKGYLLYAGGLYEEKGVDLLLDSLDKNGYALPLHIAGAGPEAEALQAKAKGKNVTFLGHLSKDQLAKELAGALAVVVPSRWYENYPYSVLEAFAHGRPVIASNIGGLPEMVQPGKTGWLFTMDSVDELSEIIRTIASTPQICKELGQQARKWVE